MKLDKQVAIVTGSTKGIGLAIAQAFLSEGARVVLSGRNQANIESYPASSHVHAVQGDITNPATRKALLKETIEQFGDIHILVNNVGGGSDARLIEEVSDEDLRSTLVGNLECAFSLSRLVIPQMKRNAYGRIVNIASIAGRHKGRLSGPQYSAAKAGMLGMTRHFAFDLAPHGITVNAVAPGFVMTERAQAKWKTRSEQERNSMLEGVPAGRWGEPGEIAAAVLYFASPEAAYTTGACLDVNGGSYMG